MVIYNYGYSIPTMDRFIACDFVGRTDSTEASQVSGLGQVQEWLKPATLMARARKVILVRFEA